MNMTNVPETKTDRKPDLQQVTEDLREQNSRLEALKDALWHYGNQLKRKEEELIKDVQMQEADSVVTSFAIEVARLRKSNDGLEALVNHMWSIMG